MAAPGQGWTECSLWSLRGQVLLRTIEMSLRTAFSSHRASILSETLAILCAVSLYNQDGTQVRPSEA